MGDVIPYVLGIAPLIFCMADPLMQLRECDSKRTQLPHECSENSASKLDMQTKIIVSPRSVVGSRISSWDRSSVSTGPFLCPQSPLLRHQPYLYRRTLLAITIFQL